MDKLHKITSNTKEKELALSLFRIPINFFAEDKKSPNIKTSSSQDDNLKIKKDNNSPTSTSPDKKIDVKLSPDKSSTNISLNFEFDDTGDTKKISKNKKSSDEEDTSTSNATQNQNESSSKNDSNSTTETNPTDVSSNNEPSPQPNDSNDTSDKTKDVTSSQPAEQNENPQPPITNPSNQESSPSSPSNIPSTSDTPDTKSNKKPSNDDSLVGETPGIEPPDEPSDNKDKNKNKNKKDKDANKFKDKYGNKKPEKKSNDNLQNSKAGQKANDIKNKITDNPAASKLPGINEAKDIKDKSIAAKEAIQNQDVGKMSELAEDAAVKIAAKAGDAVVPGAGTAIGAVDKAIGDTEIGKATKKHIGCIIGAGCLIPLISLIMLFSVLSTPIMWISNLFGGIFGRNNIVGELTEKEFEDLQKASTLYSMESYEDFTTQLNNPGWWKEFWGTASKYPIEESLDTYLKNYYYYDENLIKDYNTDYKDLIKKNYIPELNEGDLTSFGMSFELLISHYSLSSLKAPSSSPQRAKEVDGKTVTYYLDTNGAHMQLFEDVLKSTDPNTMNNSNNLLVSRFSGQVSKKWFIDDGSDINYSSDFSKWLDSEDKKAEVPDKVKSLTNTSKDVSISLSTILNTKIKDVYIKEYNETRDISLRDLLEITSTNSYDTQYYTSLVKNILKDTSYIGNIKLNKLFTILTKRLASIELMTYMLYYQKYQKTMENFLTSIEKYDNSNRFSESFFEQFMTLSHVQHFIALSSSIDEPSLAYEIAVASFEAASQSIETEVLPNNYIGIKKYSNWFATYHFTNSVYATDDDTYQFYMNISDVTPTYTQQQLFDKYNVNHGLYDKFDNLTDEEKADLNKNSFFELFETATGIDTAFDANGNISLRTPGGISYECAEGKFFPIDSNVNAVITCAFGQMYSDAALQQLGRAGNRPEGHHGIDYGIPVGTSIFAASSGTAYTFAQNTGYGNYVRIVHDDGYVSIYAHGNGTFFITNGSHVNAGDPIMQSGNSGDSTGPHLHFEMYDPSGTRIDPNNYLYGIL